MATGSLGRCFPPLRGSSPSSHPKVSCNSLSPPLFKTLSDIQSSGVIACLRAPSAELALGAARAAITGGIKVFQVSSRCCSAVRPESRTSFFRCLSSLHPRPRDHTDQAIYPELEVVRSTPGVFEVLRELVEEHPTMSLGVGTILNAEDAIHAIKVGAKFLISPAMIKDILADVQGSEVLYIPGVMTPSEILSAHSAGAKIVKIYPVSALGGVEYISALKKPFPHIPMVASQGVQIGLVGEYIARGASAVVLSDAVFNKEAVVRGEYNAISRQAKVAASVAEEAIKRLDLFEQRQF